MTTTMLGGGGGATCSMFNVRPAPSVDTTPCRHEAGRQAHADTARVYFHNRQSTLWRRTSRVRIRGSRKRTSTSATLRGGASAQCRERIVRRVVYLCKRPRIDAPFRLGSSSADRDLTGSFDWRFFCPHRLFGGGFKCSNARLKERAFEWAIGLSNGHLGDADRFRRRRHQLLLGGGAARDMTRSIGKFLPVAALVRGMREA